ncbi:MAG: hypothetical protein JNK38_16935 [Acidobacteria bacterium]|nr:hypothetical protein [Acidobacteriota bacterium]
MIASTRTLQLGTHQGIMAGLTLQREPEVFHGVSSDFFLPASSHLLNLRAPASIRNTPAELAFPTFGYRLPVLMKSSLVIDKQHLTLRIEVDEGVALVWKMTAKQINSREKVIFEGTVGIEITSEQARAHFFAATLQALLMLDKSATLQASEIQFSANAHFTDSLRLVSKFLQRRQLAYQLMVAEKAFHQQFPVQSQLSESQRSDINFVYRAVAEKIFDWPFWQDSFALTVNEQARTLLAGIDGAHPFVIEIGCLQHPLLEQKVSLGQVDVIVQNAVIVNSDEVSHALQQPEGHAFQATIRSLSGRATYQFFETPVLPANDWEPRIAELIALENKLDEQFFQAVNQLAASTLADLTDEEIDEVTAKPQLDEEAFSFDAPEGDD